MGTVQRIVSGGQTGVDTGALDAAIELGVPFGGWAPQGWWTEAGTIKAKYRVAMKEDGAGCAKLPIRVALVRRTQRNVVESDATLVFTVGPLNLRTGSAKTVAFAQKHKRPCLHIDLDRPSDLRAWLSSFDGDITLNIAGSRESRSPGIAKRVRSFLVATLA